MKLKIAKKKKKQPKLTYDERSPITGNFTVLVEDVEHNGKTDLYKVCMETGYQTYYNTWRDSNPEIIAVVERQMPDYVVASKFVDKLGVHWYPMMTMSIFGILHPIKDNMNQLKWAFSDLSRIEDSNEINSKQIVRMPIQTSDGVKIALFKVNDTPIQTWELTEFEDAFGYYQDVVKSQLNKSDEEE